MLALLSPIVGFLGGFLPDILKFLQQKEDHKHEIEVLKLQMEAQAQTHVQKLEEINTEADIKESASLYTAAELKPSGVAWADAALYLYNGTVRPTITYGFTGLYGFVKIAQFWQMETVQIAWDKAIILMWTEFDASALLLVLSYYFGQRQAAKVFRLGK